MRVLAAIVVALVLTASAFAASGVDWTAWQTWNDDDRTAAILELHNDQSYLQEKLAALEASHVAETASLNRYIRYLRRCVQKQEADENACVRKLVYEGRTP